MMTGRATTDAWMATLVSVAMAGCGPGTGDGPPRLAAASAPLASQQAKLLAGDGAESANFGASVGISGTTAVVGANHDGELGPDAGAAYVFVRGGATWSQQAKLVAGDGAAGEDFGTSVAVSGDTALVGAIFDSDVGGSQLGAAYVFVRSGASWVQQAKLVAGDGVADDQFGTGVALAGDTALIGAVNNAERGDHAGAAYVFVRSGASWTLQAKLTAADAGDFDQFGTAVALSGDTAVIGAGNASAGAGRPGAVYVFTRSGTSWTQQAKLVAGDGGDGDHFGAAVAVSGDSALVGAFRADPLDQDSGAAYAFVRGGASWTQQARLVPDDGRGFDNFGLSVALLDDTAVVGAPFASDRGAASGTAYVFARSGASWTQTTKLSAGDGASLDFLGISAAVSGTTALLGATGRDDLGSSSGAAYVFALAAGDNGAACTASTDCTSGFCADGVCCDSACGGGDPGDCEACSVAAGAAVDGVCAPRSAGTVCRAAAGACDVAETCTGSSAACPADGLASPGTVCRAAAGACDVAETCTGSSAACPADGFIAAGAVCRAAAGACDVAETCTGSSVACPADGLASAGTVCRAAAGACDVAESCTGSSAMCPGDGFRTAGTVCRSAAGVCDVAESCTGSSAACPGDGLAGAGTVCRPAAGSCDLAETCSGGAVSCPPDQHKLDLSLCHGLLGLPGVCLAGVCVL